jgi:hypothetical protein
MFMPRLVVGFLMAFAGVAAPAFSDTLLQIPNVMFAAPPQVFAAAVSSQGSAPPPVAFSYSDAYRTRAKIHRIASYATLPLFATEAIVGQSLYTDPTSGKKSAHLAVATGMGVLFGVNTVTGVWNLIEARQDPSHRGTRLLHGILMLAADGGFLATAALGPSEHSGNFADARSTHRTVAFTSIGLATAGYLVMLLGGH